MTKSAGWLDEMLAVEGVEEVHVVRYPTFVMRGGVMHVVPPVSDAELVAEISVTAAKAPTARGDQR